MDKKQFARLARHQKIAKVLHENAAEAADVPAFAALSAAFQQKLALLDGAARRQPIVSKGATETKGTAALALIPKLVKAANALSLLYKSEGNLEAARKLHLQPSQYKALPAQELATEAKDLAAAVAARAKDLVAYNLKADQLKDLADGAAAYAAVLGAPQAAIDANKIKGATSTALLRDVDTYLTENLRSGFELLADTHPELYKALREASQIDDRGSRKAKQTEKTAAGAAQG